MYILEDRPRKLSQIVGQKAVKMELTKRSKNMAFPPFMLLSGVTGTGKTTTTLIIASLLNCHNPVFNSEGYYEPCLTCDSCKDIIEEKFSRDIHLIDCSSMGKEDVLKLKDRISLYPMYDKNKILILEEAQQLSSAGSRGALLTLLEKVYKNAYIIMNTMDEDKFDKAILTRAIKYKFKKPTSSEIAEHLFNIIKEKKVEVPDDFITQGIFSIAEYCNGSVREAVSTLEKCLTAEIFNSRDIEKEFDLITETSSLELIKKILSKDYTFFRDIEGINLLSFYNLSWVILNNALIYKYNPRIPFEDWKKENYNKINSYDNIEELIRTYLEVYESSSYFKDSYFISKILKFYIGEKSKEEVSPKVNIRPVKEEG